ncbi:MAG: LCP family protein, partial [Anaerolineae bacterium]
QQLLRAILNQGVDLGMVTEAPTLWSVYKDRVETDLDIGRILQLATIATAVKENGIQHLYLAKATTNWTTPNGASVLLPRWEGTDGMAETFTRLFEPIAMRKSGRQAIFVEVINATHNEDLAVLAADNLAWQGFVPVIGPAEYQEDAQTSIEYFGPNFKGSYNQLLTWVFGKGQSFTKLVDDPDYPYDYRVALGEDYNPCRDAIYAP